MIFYFSATGNSEYIASRLACETGEKLLPMVWCLDHKQLFYRIPRGERIGIVTPTYFWGIPNIVSLFMKYVRFSYDEKPYIYFVTTYGSSPGQSWYFTERCLKKHNHTTFDAYYSLKMPHTWTPIHNVDNPDRISHILSGAKLREDRLIDRVLCKDKGDFMQDATFHFTRSMYRKFYDNARITSMFHLRDGCNGCGLCAAGCPVHAIEMREGKPAWVKERCTLCLGCLHGCPEFAIQYGSRTCRHGQYHHPEVDINSQKIPGFVSKVVEDDSLQ